MYPRIDSEVSKKRNHLLKAPFCIHPATGRANTSSIDHFRSDFEHCPRFCPAGNICVPIDPAEVHNFDPKNVPTIHKLIEELDRIIVEDGAEHHSGALVNFEILTKLSNSLMWRSLADWEQTSLRQYVQLFDKHVQGLMREVRTANKGGL